MTRAVEERFWAKVDKTGECWLWTAYIDRPGYGRVYWDRTMRLAHRVSYALTCEIPIGEVPAELDHLCRTPACVRPDHLEPVTHLENVRRGRAGEVNAARLRGRTSCKNGHLFTPENTYVYPNGWRECRTCQRARKRGYYHADLEQSRALGRETQRKRYARKKEAAS